MERLPLRSSATSAKSGYSAAAIASLFYPDAEYFLQPPPRASLLPVTGLFRYLPRAKEVE